MPIAIMRFSKSRSGLRDKRSIQLHMVLESPKRIGRRCGTRRCSSLRDEQSRLWTHCPARRNDSSSGSKRRFFRLFCCVFTIGHLLEHATLEIVERDSMIIFVERRVIIFFLLEFQILGLSQSTLFTHWSSGTEWIRLKTNLSCRSRSCRSKSCFQEPSQSNQETA